MPASMMNRAILLLALAKRVNTVRDRLVPDGKSVGSYFNQQIVGAFIQNGPGYLRSTLDTHTLTTEEAGR